MKRKVPLLGFRYQAERLINWLVPCPQERAMLEEENKKLKSKNDALIVSEVYSSDEEEEEDA